MPARDWFLTAAERDNPDTEIDRRHANGFAWTEGNEVRPLLHGAPYFAELLESVRAMRRGDLLLFTDWRGDPDEPLDGPGTEVSKVFTEAAARGVIVRGLIWRSHLDKFQFSAAENRHLGEDIEAAGGRCLLDMRVRPGGSHHQKLVVLRHPGRPELDVAYLGGIDLCHSRRDDERHHGDVHAQRMSKLYGPRPPWHDVQVAIRGPAVGDLEATFRERWNDPSLLARNPLSRLRELVSREDTHGEPLPAQLPDPAPRGTHAVQILRTYPYRRHGYPFARNGERSVARAYAKAVERARSLIYIEDQYLWSAEVARLFASVLAARPELRLLAVIPRHPDQDGMSGAAQAFGRELALELLHKCAPGRVMAFGLENEDGTPIYVHAKVSIIDDTWMSVGSDNLNLRSWTHDSELSCAVMDEDGDLPRRLRLTLCREHLGRELSDVEDPFDAFRESAAALDAWHRDGRRGPRPPGRLRGYTTPQLSRLDKLYAQPLYHLVYDPDGRPPQLRRVNGF